MQRIVYATLALLVMVLMAVPASAINVPGCGEFIIFAKNTIVFEAGNTLLTGNVFLQNPTGTVRVGSNNVIHGTITANRIQVANGATVDECVANVIEVEGTGKCGISTIGFTPAAACTASFPPAPLTVPTFPAQCSPGTVVNVLEGTNVALAPGCYDRVRVNRGATLTLTPGGTYFVKGEIRQLGGDKPGQGSTIIGGTGQPQAAAILNVAGQYITESGVFITNLTVNSTNTSGQAVQVFNNSLVRDVLFASLGTIHPHGGTQLRGNTELVGANFADIEPITNDNGAPSPNVCICQVGFHFLNEVATNPNDRVCVPD